MFLALPNPLFVHGGRGSLETSAIDGIVLEHKNSKNKVVVTGGYTNTKECIVLFSTVIVTLCALYKILGNQ
jgi:hypothetical protein